MDDTLGVWSTERVKLSLLHGALDEIQIELLTKILRIQLF